MTKKFSTSWKMKKSKSKLKMLNVEKIKDPIEINKYRNNISEEVKRIMNQQCTKDDNQETRWKNIKVTIDIAAKDPRTRNTTIKKKHWFNEQCQRAISKRNEARLKMLQNPTPETTEEYRTKKEIAKKTFRREKRLAEKEMLENIEKGYNNPREFFKKCRTVRQDIKAQTFIIKDDNDDILTEPTKIVEKFRLHFEELLNNNSTNGIFEKYEELIYQTEEPELAKPDPEEIDLIIKGFKNFKAPGEDEINPELLKLAGKDLKTELYLLIKDVWKNECMPKDWNLGIICPIFKKGDIKKVTNYRGISLLDTAYKVLSIAILRRLEMYAKDIVGEYQCGFKKSKSTTDHIHTLR